MQTRTKEERGRNLASAQLIHFSCSKAPNNQGARFDWFGENLLSSFVFKMVSSKVMTLFLSGISKRLTKHYKLYVKCIP